MLWHVVLWFVACGAAAVEMCSSLEGPRCHLVVPRVEAGEEVGGSQEERLFVKELEKEEPLKTPLKTKEASWRDRLVAVVQRHLLEETRGRSAVQGAFEVYGSAPDAEGRFHLKAGAWLRQPSGWITVGLRGAFENNVTVSGEIVEESGEVLEACSRFALRKNAETFDDRETSSSLSDDDSPFSLAGEWAGVYHCGGTPTRLLLTLADDHPVAGDKVSGTFEFAVLNDLDDQELQELATIVSESLLDVADGDDTGDVELYVVDEPHRSTHDDHHLIEESPPTDDHRLHDAVLLDNNDRSRGTKRPPEDDDPRETHDDHSDVPAGAADPPPPTTTTNKKRRPPAAPQ